MDHSDHLFLLRKGVVSGRISFDVAPKVAENGDLHRGGHSNACSDANHDDRGKNNGSTEDPKVNPEEDIGRGYDSGIPAVFKAKVQRTLFSRTTLRFL